MVCKDEIRHIVEINPNWRKVISKLGLQFSDKANTDYNRFSEIYSSEECDVSVLRGENKVLIGKADNYIVVTPAEQIKMRVDEVSLWSRRTMHFTYVIMCLTFVLVMYAVNGPNIHPHWSVLIGFGICLFIVLEIANALELWFKKRR